MHYLNYQINDKKVTNAVRQTVAVRNQGAIARCYIQVKI
ncbi:hypothetical protein T12_3410 [Trichinella patagoniensis]|uniref:Uncharacterized protein n=1 Tax=Trichinella patagoniensis TaxID=990121 RepID=A0A0V0YCE1_9BILA|nr:hypothetical protein T12_3410 [Trichinella patagoniensis]